MHDRVCNRCKWMVSLLVMLLLALPGMPAVAGDAAPVCREDGYREFDFWIGRWQVADAEGAVAGHNVIESRQRGCLLVETWQGTEGGTGTSINYYHPIAGTWRQVWVSPGTVIDISGNLSDGSMVLSGTIAYRDGRSLPFRGTWTLLEDGRVRQFFEEQQAPGRWTTWFEGFYTRMESPGS